MTVLESYYKLQEQNPHLCSHACTHTPTHTPINHLSAQGKLVNLAKNNFLAMSQKRTRKANSKKKKMYSDGSHPLPKYEHS